MPQLCSHFHFHAILFLQFALCGVSQSYSTQFNTPDPENWSIETGCDHCINKGGDECTQFTESAIKYGAVKDGQGMNITTEPLIKTSACGGLCTSGHLKWNQPVQFGTFTVAARWFPNNDPDSIASQRAVSSASGFIGLFGSGKLGGSITFIFHGAGWDGEIDEQYLNNTDSDYAHTFQSEVYRTGENHNKVNTKIKPDLASEIALYELEWLTDRVHWRVNKELVRSWHPSSTDSIPQAPMQLRLHSRSGHCSRMDDSTYFDAQILNFTYTPATATNTYIEPLQWF